MPKVPSDVPDTLRPYIFHGVDLNWKPGDKEAVGECPFCSRTKLSVSIETGVYRCLVCGTGNDKGGGNSYVFIRQLWDVSDRDTRDYSGLLPDRGLLEEQTLMSWGVARSISTGDWIVPGHSVDRKLNQLYRYVRMNDGKFRLIPTPTHGHQLHGVDLHSSSNDVIYLCEGPWDAMALWEVLGKAKLTDAGLATTGNLEVSLRSGASVLAVPGCNTFLESWRGLFAGKLVYIMYDSDHPRNHPATGARIEPAGYAGLKRVARLLSDSPEPPEEIRYLDWGPEGYDPTLPTGYDLRDALRHGGDGLAGRLTGLAGILSRIAQVPAEWLSTRPKTSKPGTNGSRKKGSGDMETLPCESYQALVTSWRKAMKWTDGLDHALAVMLASITSTKVVGDQLWIKVIGPASCGKSTLCEAVSVAKEYVLAKSTIRGFHSGFGDGSDDDDNSLISQLRDKTLVTKDGDTLLQSPNLGQILAEARDIYDTTSRTSYRNRNSRDYCGVRMTWLLCGTSSLRSIDSSELGERFLDCVIMETIDDELEDEILWRVANRTDRNLSIEADGKAETHQAPEMTAVMQLTGGYVEYLRQNAIDILSAIDLPDPAKRKCTRLGKFVAFMRARPSTRQEETAEREFAARLVSQLIRLAKCLAAVLNRKRVDDLVMERVRRVAFDTARGQTLEIARHLFNAPDGLEVKTIAMWTNRTEDKTRTMLRFLSQIGVAEPRQPASVVRGISQKPRWYLTERMRKLYSEVTDVLVENLQ